MMQTNGAPPFFLKFPILGCCSCKVRFWFWPKKINKTTPFQVPNYLESSRLWHTVVFVCAFCDQRRRKDVRPSVLLKPSNHQSINWLRPCWKAWWSRLLCHWLPWLQACYSSRLWHFWYLPTISKTCLCFFLFVWFNSSHFYFIVWYGFCCSCLIVHLMGFWFNGHWFLGCAC